VRGDGVLTVVEILGLCRVNVASARAHSQSRGVLPLLAWRDELRGWRERGREDHRERGSSRQTGQPDPAPGHLGTLGL